MRARTLEILREVDAVPERAVGAAQADVAARADEQHAAETQHVAAQRERHQLPLQLERGREVRVLNDGRAAARAALREVVGDVGSGIGDAGRDVAVLLLLLIAPSMPISTGARRISTLRMLSRCTASLAFDSAPSGEASLV